jgi:hypothetical protein
MELRCRRNFAITQIVSLFVNGVGSGKGFGRRRPVVFEGVVIEFCWMDWWNTQKLQ